MRRWCWMLVVLAACRVGGAASPPGSGVVDRVIDGDTIDVRIGGRRERVRLIGIDTPEVAHAGSTGRPGNAAECYGDAAAAFTADLLPDGTEVRLERDVVARDDYGRLLAYVRRAGDGLLVNRELVRAGYARLLTIPPNVADREQLAAAARDAERAGAGLWTACR